MPDTLTELCESIQQTDSRSSLFVKVDADLRKELVDALIKRKPYTYRAVFDHFDLPGRGISFTAFYYWARRVRRNAALVEMARSCDHGGDGSDNDPVRLVPRVIGQRLLDACLDEDIGIDILDRLSRTYLFVNRVEALRHKLPRPSATPSMPNVLPESGSALDLATLEKLTSFYAAAANARLAESSKNVDDKGGRSTMEE